MAFACEMLIILIFLTVNSFKLHPVAAQSRIEVVEGTDVIMDCSEFNNETTIRTIVWIDKYQTTLMQQNNRTGFREIPESRYKSRLSIPEWGICYLSNITSGDAEDYLCEQRQPSYTNNKTFLYTIVGKPGTPSLHVSSSRVQQGDTVLFTCEPFPNTKGALNFTLLKASGDIIKNISKYFLITNATSEHSGNYSCQVGNIAGISQWSQPVGVDVLSPTTVPETTVGITEVATTITTEVPTTYNSDTTLMTKEASTYGLSRGSTRVSSEQSTVSGTTGPTEEKVSTTSEATSEPPQQGALSPAAIAGIAVGSVAVGVILVAITAVVVLKSRKSSLNLHQDGLSGALSLSKQQISKEPDLDNDKNPEQILNTAAEL